MGDRKYRLHMEEKEYIFQYEGDRMMSPEEILRLIQSFRAGVLGKRVETKGGGISLIREEPRSMGFDR